jgi:hypothetical protein
MGKLHEVEAKLDELIEAHRAMAAQHEALFQTSKIMFALIDSPLPMKRHLIQSLRLATIRHLNQGPRDDQYQEMVSAALAELQEVALAGNG